MPEGSVAECVYCGKTQFLESLEIDSKGRYSCVGCGPDWLPRSEAVEISEPDEETEAADEGNAG